jgi:V8-like Glu-specific endopeptidase
MSFSGQRLLQTLGIALALGIAGCFGTPASSGAPEEDAAHVDLALDYQDIEAPAGYEEPVFEHAELPLSADDPRGFIEIDPEVVMIDPGLFDPPPGPDDLIEKWKRNPDERTVVANTTLAPQKMAAMLIITLDGVTSICSGVMVGKDAVLTNGHCIFDPRTQHWASNVVVVPGAYPDPANAARYRSPFGTSSGRRLFTPTNWRLGVGNVQSGHDYGIIRTNNANFVTEWRTVGFATNPAGNVEYYGYQGDLTLYQMYRTRGPIDRWFDQANGLMQMKLSLFQGGSGSGVSATAASSIVALMRATSVDFNFAVFFNQTKRDEIRAWIIRAL